MPRQQTPLHIAEATGDLEHNKKRYKNRATAPQPTGEIGDPPNHFDDIDRDHWREVAAMTAPGVLTSADRLLVEITAKLMRRLPGRSEDAKFNPLSPVELGHLRSCLGSMGLTPADRGRVTAPNAPKAKNPLDKFKPKTIN